MEKRTLFTTLLVLFLSFLSFILLILALILFGDLRISFGSKSPVLGLDKPVTVTPSDCSECPPVRLRLSNDGYLDIPLGWYISGLSTDFRILTAEEVEEYTNNRDGVWPIFRGLNISISDGSNEIEIYKVPTFAPNGISGLPLIADDEAVIVSEPTTDKLGLIRILENSIYTYYPITLIENYERPTVEQGDHFPYRYIGFGKGDVLFTYKGDEAKLEFVEEFLVEICVEDRFMICELM